MGSRKGAKAKGNALERRLEVDLEGVGFSVLRGSGADQSKFKAPDLLVPGDASMAGTGGCARPTIAIEAKNHASWPWSTWIKAYDQGAAAATSDGGDVVVAVVAHRHGTNEDYVLIKWEHWLRVLTDAYR